VTQYGLDRKGGRKKKSASDLGTVEHTGQTAGTRQAQSTNKKIHVIEHPPGPRIGECQGGDHGQHWRKSLYTLYVKRD